MRLLMASMIFGVVAAGPTLPDSPKVPAKPPIPLRNFTQTLPNTKITFDMVYLPGGEYERGSPEDESDREAHEGPRHTVKLRPFWIGKCEVTWDEFALWYKNENLFAFDTMPANLAGKLAPDAVTKPTAPYIEETYGYGESVFPVISITHHAAMMYCHWLRHVTKLGYRLPTEAEWEFAARGGKATGPFGIEGRLEDHAWFRGNSGTPDFPDGTTHKVGTRKPNAFGIFDLHGNVAEWCLDQYDAKAYDSAAGKLGPVTVPTEKKWSHVVRGGSWADKPDRLRCAARRVSDKSWQKYDPQIPQSLWWLTKMETVGFRVCLSAEEYENLLDLKPKVVKKEE